MTALQLRGTASLLPLSRNFVVFSATAEPRRFTPRAPRAPWVLRSSLLNSLMMLLNLSIMLLNMCKNDPRSCWKKLPDNMTTGLV